jgi:hypothetical protein
MGILGFKHSAFVFHGESLLTRSPNLLQTDMPPGTLVTLLQKALLFLYVETHVANDGQTIQCDEAFSLLKPHDHDHGPLDSQIQFDESVAEHVDVNGKRVGPPLGEEQETREMSSKPPPPKKPKQAKASKSSGDEPVDQTEVRDHIMIETDTSIPESRVTDRVDVVADSGSSKPDEIKPDANDI